MALDDAMNHLLDARVALQDARDLTHPGGPVNRTITAAIKNVDEGMRIHGLAHHGRAVKEEAA